LRGRGATAGRRTRTMGPEDIDLLSGTPDKGIIRTDRSELTGEMVDKGVYEWGWDDSPIVLPLALHRREWNAVYIAAHLAEYCGARLVAFHVKSERERIDTEFRSKVESFLSLLRIKFEFEEAKVKGQPSFETIAQLIVDQAKVTGAQAVVMSAHKEGFLLSLVGRVSDRVARKNQARTVLVESPRPEMKVPDHPKKVLVMVKEGTKSRDAYVVAAALTSLATTPDAELIATQAIVLPPTVPLDAVDFSETLKDVEREFAYSVADSIRSLGRIFTPRLLVVRELGRDISNYAQQEGADLMVLTGRSKKFSELFGKDTKEIVRNSPCVVLVVFPARA